MAQVANRESQNNPSIKQLADGSVILPPFAILDECTFFNPKRGEWVKMDEKRLNKLADSINERFNKKGETLPIIPGHTKDGLDEEKQPRIIGGGVQAVVRDFVNPRTGQKQDFKSLYITPIASPGEVETFKKLSRGRSVELWLNPDDISAVSLLGANAPHRDLGPHLFDKQGKLPNHFRYSEVSPHRFDKTNGRDDDPVNVSSGDEEGKEMADEPNKTDDKPPETPDKPADKPNDSLIQEFLAAFLQSDLGKRLETLAETLEATLSGGAPGAAASPVPGSPAPGAMPGSPEPGPTDYDDLFAPAPGGSSPAPAGGMPPMPEKKPDEKMAASCAGPMNTSMPGYDKPESNKMSRNPEDQVRMARMEQKIAEQDRFIKELLNVNLAKDVDRDLRVLETQEKLLFDFDTEFKTLMRMEKAEDRQAHMAHMIKFYRHQEDRLPNDGRFSINPTSVAVRFAKEGEKIDGVSDPMEAESVANEVAKRTYEYGEKGVSIESVLAERRSKATNNGQMAQVR